MSLPIAGDGASKMEQQWEQALAQFKELSSTTLGVNVSLTRRVQQLEEELSVWKQARTATVEQADRDKRQHEDEKAGLLRRISNLEMQQEHDCFIFCVIDGDGNIFSDLLLSAGQDGGREAAQMMTKGVADHLQRSGFQTRGRLWLWVTIYFNKKGLHDTLVNNGHCTSEQFEGFLLGFSQASPRFLIADVGYGKEAADVKIKEYLQTYTRFPQTMKVFFGGGHDNGYLPTLASLENEQLLDKLVVLKGYDELAIELQGLKLETYQIDGLFRTQKVTSSPRKRAQVVDSPRITIDDATSPRDDLLLSPFSRSKTSSSSYIPQSNGVNGITSSPTKERPLNPSLPLSKRTLQLQLELHLAAGKRSSKLNFSAETPAPCNEFYLIGKCPRTTNCKYGHDYLLTAEHMSQLASNAKKAPCAAARRGVTCSYGPRCIWGHECPYGQRCTHLAQGRCWFKGPTSHGSVPPTPTEIEKEIVVM
ncbi:hypothetical protein SCHPADRAFT_860173 [Schizopora paradoxa]|uniref:C3H1-type domain-containing protein n=1 Tax=Schizopora paradoxa TaxID=27342 RepID=A0A0H2RDD8_9AGAM|nr:hypothetical protein SCHPADRAFT_860173 [Schizopora paradoxa]